jgi:hypothetical protein
MVATQGIANSQERAIARQGEIPLTVLAERTTRMQAAAVETVWEIGALPAAGRGTRVPSGAVPDPVEAARVRAVRVAHRVCAVEGVPGGVGAVGADEGERP